MKRFVRPARSQLILLPDCLTASGKITLSASSMPSLMNWIWWCWALRALYRKRRAGRPAYHPSTLLKIYLYGYLNRVQSSRRLEREAQRNIELMWLTGRLAPDFKTIADFRKDNGAAIRAVCGQFVELCRRLKLFISSVVAIDGSKFKG